MHSFAALQTSTPPNAGIPSVVFCLRVRRFHRPSTHVPPFSPPTHFYRERQPHPNGSNTEATPLVSHQSFALGSRQAPFADNNPTRKAWKGHPTPSCLFHLISTSSHFLPRHVPCHPSNLRYKLAIPLFLFPNIHNSPPALFYDYERLIPIVCSLGLSGFHLFGGMALVLHHGWTDHIFGLAT